MEKVLVIAEEIFLTLYRPGLEYYSKNHDNLTIDIYCLDVPKKELNIFDRLRYKFDINCFKKKYYDKKRQELSELVKQYDTILFINLFYDDEYFIQGKFREELKKKNIKLYFVDTVKSINSNIDFFDVFSEVYSFEEGDVQFLKEKYNRACTYLPVGTSYKYFIDDNWLGADRDIDVCFVGIASPKRLEYLEAIADYCNKNGFKIFIAGHFWHNNNWLNYTIGKMKFARKHPLISHYVQNIFIQPNDLANIYCRSKIVLNINMAYHKNPNQRNFDVMVCKSLLITDKQEIGNLKLVNGKEFIMTDGAESMVKVIDYYLHHEDERLKIAEAGQKNAEQNFLYEKTLDVLIGKNSKA